MTKRGFSLVEVIVALGITCIMALAIMQLVIQQNNALTHFRIRSEMLNLMVTATVSGSPCKSIKTSGGTPPLGVCGSPNTPQTISILYADGVPVATNSGYLLQGDCHQGYYQLLVKSSLVTKVDPFNNEAIGVSWVKPADIRFGSSGWMGACP